MVAVTVKPVVRTMDKLDKQAKLLSLVIVLTLNEALTSAFYIPALLLTVCLGPLWCPSVHCLLPVKPLLFPYLTFMNL